MSDIKVTQAEIDLLLNSADVQVRTEFGKCTVVTVRLRNGFILTESSACVDPANYDVELGKKLCFQHIENRLWELEGYALQKRMDEEHDAKCEAAEVKTHDFGWAPRSCVPWLASQTDMLAEDWEIMEVRHG